MSDSILDKILGMFTPLVDFTTKNYDNNYMLYAIFGFFILLLGLILYIILKLFDILP